MKDKLIVSYRHSIAKGDTQLFWIELLEEIKNQCERINDLVFLPGKLITDQVKDLEFFIRKQESIKEIKEAYINLHCFEFPAKLSDIDNNFSQRILSFIDSLTDEITKIISAILIEKPELEDKFGYVKISDYRRPSYISQGEIQHKRSTVNKYLPKIPQMTKFSGIVNIKDGFYDFKKQILNSKTRIYPDDFTIGWFDELKDMKSKLQTSKYLKGCILERLDDEDYMGLLMCAKNNSSNTLSFSLTSKKGPISLVCDNLQEISHWLLNENVLNTPTYYEKVLFTILYEKL